MVGPTITRKLVKVTSDGPTMMEAPLEESPIIVAGALPHHHHGELVEGL